MPQSQSEQKFYEYGYKFFIQQNNQEIDWEQRRYEIAKEVTASVVATPWYHGNEHQLAEMAVKYADALIEELKK